MNAAHPTTLLDKALDIIRKASSGAPYGTRAALARATGESEANICRWLNGTSTPTLKKLEPILSALGVRLTLPGEREPAPTLVVRSKSLPGLVPESFSFEAIPMVGEVGAGGGVLPQEHEPPEWMVARQEDATQRMWAMRVARHERSMMPNICPNDIVIIDRTYRQPPQTEDIYLVQEPPSEGGGYLLKRVIVSRVRAASVVVFYSDNAREGHHPLLYELSLYPAGSLAEVIKGRVTHIWADVRQR